MSLYPPYRWCVALNCKNSTLKTPDKLFIKVPNDVSRRVWLELAGRDARKYSIKSHLHLCEDHFDLEQDMENYVRYKIMGSVKKIRMKQNIVPSKFNHMLVVNPNQTAESPSLSILQPGPSTSFLEEEISSHTEQIIEEQVLPSTFCNKQIVIPCEAAASTSVSIQPKYTENIPHTTDKGIQVQIMPRMEYKCVQANTRKYRSKGTQMNLKMKHMTTSPIKLSTSVATSPHIKMIGLDLLPSSSTMTRPVRRQLCTLFVEKSDSESFTPSITGSTSQEFSPMKSTTSDSTLPEEIKKRDQISNLENTLKKIKAKPRLYIGITNELYFLIGIIQSALNISESNILLCLTKIRLNSSFSQIADDFGLSLSQVSKVFSANIIPISKVMSPFIKQFNIASIKLNLPIPFRHRYNKVTCIIDCLEIEIQKPTNAVHQALTWSEYKKANTIKYLIACTPDGLVSFISAGYGGRITDIALFQESKFLETLPSKACILADRGFKHVEAYLTKNNMSLMRPPSVASGSKLSKAEVRQTKEIASLRIHVERVIRRLREFAILKPHSVVNINLVHVLDARIITACGLINLQDTIIK